MSASSVERSDRTILFNLIIKHNVLSCYIIVISKRLRLVLGLITLYIMTVVLNNVMPHMVYYKIQFLNGSLKGNLLHYNYKTSVTAYLQQHLTFKKNGRLFYTHL